MTTPQLTNTSSTTTTTTTTDLPPFLFGTINHEEKKKMSEKENNLCAATTAAGGLPPLPYLRRYSHSYLGSQLPVQGIPGFRYSDTYAFIMYQFTTDDQPHGQHHHWNGPRVVSGTSPYLSIHVMANCLHYGQTLFEGIKVFHQQNGTVAVFNDLLSWRRMKKGAQRLAMKCPPKHIFQQAIDLCVQYNLGFIPRYHSNLSPHTVLSHTTTTTKEQQDHDRLLLPPVPPSYTKSSTERGCSLYLRPFLFGSGHLLTFILLSMPVSTNYYPNSNCPTITIPTTPPIFPPPTTQPCHPTHTLSITDNNKEEAASCTADKDEEDAASYSTEPYIYQENSSGGAPTIQLPSTIGLSGLQFGNVNVSLPSVSCFVTSSYDRVAPYGLGQVKAGGNYAADILPSLHHKQKGYALTLYLDPVERKYIQEFGTSNFVCIIGNTYVTPESTTVLDSITNQCLQTIAKHFFHMKIEKRRIHFDREVHLFEEVAAVGTAVVITKVGEFCKNDRIFHVCKPRHRLHCQEITTPAENHAERGEGAEEVGMLERLYNVYVQIQKGELPDVFQWLRPIHI